MGTTATCFAGIDVSKDILDCCLLLPGGKTREAAFANDRPGHAALVAWADRYAAGAPVHFCLEATGPYSEAIATHIAAGRHVSVVNPRLRKALFLPTQTAFRFNPLLAGSFARLVAAGKPKMQAIGACMRKLLMICCGVLKNRAPFDPQWASKKIA